LTKSGYRLLPRFQEDINIGQVLGSQESAEFSDEEITIVADEKQKKVFNYLLIGGGTVLLILLSLVVKMKFIK